MSESKVLLLIVALKYKQGNATVKVKGEFSRLDFTTGLTLAPAKVLTTTIHQAKLGKKVLLRQLRILGRI